MNYHSFPVPMASLSRSAPSENSSDVMKAAALARRCSMPCPAGDYVKAAIGRASDRTGISPSRMKDIWYGDARQILSREMDALRRGADQAEVDLAVAGITLARVRIEGLVSPLARDVLASFDDALRILGRGADASSGQP